VPQQQLVQHHAHQLVLTSLPQQLVVNPHSKLTLLLVQQVQQLLQDQLQVYAH